ncbi:Polyadenylate-binding protein [Scheffersomyces coipomensis]|uniref:Polyadenylate-binding protein n=1 Tax=Scheffersomyces coipomensis TaxID=1788519 RepID=UPI00315DB666
MSRSRSRRGVDSVSSEDSARPQRSSRARRQNLAGLDIDPDDDEDFDVSNVKDENNEEDDDEIPEDDDAEEVVRKRGRKRKAQVDDDADAEEENGEDADDKEEGGEGENDEDNGEEEDEEEEDEEDENGEGEGEGNTPKTEEEKRVPKKRGRKKLKITILEEGVFDEEGNPLNIANDEVVIGHEDEKGKEKIDELGNLQGGREFRMKTFKVYGQGDRLYMISTEPARLVGFRDSYLLFKTHRSLFKKVCDNDEKMDLIDRGIIPNSYKGRSVNLVTARSIFREFGAKMINGGKKVIDDFWEQRAIDNGDIPGEYADPNEFIRTNRLTNILGDSNTNGGSTPLTATPLVNYETDPAWMYKVASQTSEFNTKILEQRNQAFTRGVKDIFTNLTFYPSSTQPSKSKSEFIADSKDSLVYTTKIVINDLRKKVTGLKNVPKEIFADIEDEEIKQAILDQQKFEKENY